VPHRRPLSKPVALLAVLVAVLVFAAAAIAYAVWAGDASYIVDVELAGSSDVVAGIVKNHSHTYVVALYVDFGFIAGYTISTLIGAWLGSRLAFTSAARRVSTIAMYAVVVAALCDVGEDLCLLPVVRHPLADHDGYATAAQAFSVTKWVLVIPAAVAAVVAMGMTVWRALGVPLFDKLPERRREAAMTAAVLATRAEPVLQPLVTADVDAGPRSAWRANSTVPPERRPEQEQATAVGVCSSGGGIRSATVNLGALHSLRPVLAVARYLVSVSGGGYASSAMQLALQKPSVAQPVDVYLAGSAELDHTRRHGNYIADGAAQWAVALGSVLRGLVVNLLTLVVVVVLVGRVIAHAYAAFPHNLLQTSTWPPQHGVSWAVGVLAAVWLVLWVFGVLVEPHVPRLRGALRAASRGAVGAALLVAVAGIGLPLLAWASRTPPHRTVAVSTQATSLVVGYLATLAALGRKHAPQIKTVAGRFAGGNKTRLQTLIVYAGLLAIVGGLVLLFGDVLATTGPAGSRSTWPGHLTEGWVTLIVAAPLAFFAVVDQVRWSLHPFYKKRLATAFAVRRIVDDGHVRAVPYDFAEVTALSGEAHQYGARVPGFPQVIFSCAAHVSGQELTPPGRHVVPWTMSGDYVGSPMIGWTHSSDVYAQVAPTLRLDLTVQAAAAISGAAIASQMGRMEAAYTKLLTISNVRLGSWLPNPSYLGRLLSDLDNGWALPRLPRRRYLATLARELFGAYPADGPLVFVTDGGHYENLGLVELLRHRCGTVYCIDASGDRPDMPSILAEAVELAYEELGVVVTLDRPERLGARDGRFAQTAVVTGTIDYPDLGPGLPAKQGRIVVGKAVLTESMPFDVLAHADRNPLFPHESTGDQWFDHDQFDAYHALGRYIGAQMLTGFGELSDAAAAPTAPSSRSSAVRSRRRSSP
jgi:hypothetical protein